MLTCQNAPKLTCMQGGPSCLVHLGHEAKILNLPQKMQIFKTNLITRNALKLSYRDVEIQNFPGGETLGPS
jgi:hypothetical protein